MPTNGPVTPSIRARAFSCPHCGAFTTQTWYRLFARLSKENAVPYIARPADIQNVQNSAELSPKDRETLVDLCTKSITGLVFLQHSVNGEFVYDGVKNLNVSGCYHCHKFAVWVHDRLIFPASKMGAQPNKDLPDSIVKDFEEAREIVLASPRGAAALLRLCVQKLCKELGGSGKDLNKDIASLVKKGLNPTIQQALDVVRVIGNESVHPGVLDLRDDRDTANRLFELVNAIAEQMISHPKTVGDLYEKLPKKSRDAITARDSIKKPGK